MELAAGSRAMPPAAVRVTEVVDPERIRHVREARAGSTDAFEWVVEGVIGWAYRLASAILGSGGAAPDATENALVAAWRQLPQLRDPAQFEVWFRRILVNECRMQLRRDGRSPEAPIHEDQVGQGQLVTSAPPVPLPVDAIDLVERAMEGLAADDRILVVLYHFEDRPLDEIADALHMPLGTVKWRLREARRTLLHALEALE